MVCVQESQLGVLAGSILSLEGGTCCWVERRKRWKRYGKVTALSSREAGKGGEVGGKHWVAEAAGQSARR